MIMSAHDELLLSASQINASSPLSEAPSVLDTPIHNDYASSSTSSSLDSIPDTPSRSPRRHVGDYNDAVDSNNDNDTDIDTGVDDPAVVPTSRQEKLDAIVETLRRTK